MSDDDESFIILGSTPTASMNFGESLSQNQQPRSVTLNGPSSTLKPTMQVSTSTAANFSLLNGLHAQPQHNGPTNGAAEGNNGNVSMSNSIASRFLCGEVSRDEVMQVIEP